MKYIAIAAASLALSSSLSAAPAGNSADGILRGPFFSGTIMSSDGKSLAAGKGIVVTVGPNKDHYLCYDTDTLRCALGWSGNFLEFGKTQERIEWPPPPKIKGKLLFETKVGPGWAKPGAKSDEFTDPRPNQMGPLPKDWAKYRGLYVNGDQVVLSYSVGSVAVLELPGFEAVEGGFGVLTRTIQFAKFEQAQLLAANFGVGKPVHHALTFGVEGTNGIVSVVSLLEGTGKLEMTPDNGGLRFSPKQPLVAAKLAYWTGPAADFKRYAEAAEKHRVKAAIGKRVDLAALTKGSPAQWPAIVTKGVPGTNAGPYVVDHITEPATNAWNAKTYFGGHDFFPDGRAAVCTFHGDVWVVSGLDEKLEKITWKRFASGLFQPLGTKVVDGKVYITGRDQITRLHDLNGDGEADFYENFNNDTFVTANYHEFCLGLDTDKAGNFYYAKGAPWPPTVQSAHQGTMLKVAKDGSKLEVIATGLRAPNGMGIGPNGWITVSDNQGHYMPSSKLNLIRNGGFYGMRQAAHGKAPPDDNIHAYDQPMCWLPMGADNSSGGQVWVESTKWGPLNGQLLFMSYGKGTLFSVMPQEVDGVVQAGMVQFPLKFPSGTMRGRFSPKDGQLYTTGLRGWQTAGVRDGGFSRVRYTGAPVRMPQALHVSKDGVRITFTTALDEASAKDVGNWNVEMWNYIYSSGYGSPHVSTKDPKVKQHDKPEVTAVVLSADKKTVTLKLSELTPAMQMKVKFNLRAADGSPVASEILNTIHKVAAK